VIEDVELRDMLRATAQDATLPSVMPKPLRRKVKVRRARTIGTTVLSAIAIAVVGFQAMGAVGFDEAAPDQTAGRPSVVTEEADGVLDLNVRDARPAAAAPDVPYLIDLSTQEMMPLADAIVQRLAPGRRFQRFAAAPDGTRLAFVGRDAGGKPQIFVANVDGTGIRQLTSEPRAATSPAWSPDGTQVAFETLGEGDVRDISVVDVRTGDVRQVTREGFTHGSPRCCALEPRFTPDGSSILFGGGTDTVPLTRVVPSEGGPSELIFSPSGGLQDVGGASISPDGKLVTFLGSGFPDRDHPDVHCGPCRMVATVDGDELGDIRIVPGWVGTPAGMWSPDGTRIVSGEGDMKPNGTDGPIYIVIVDVTTGDAALVADGRSAIWLDDNTLLVDRPF
jgi:Tol biopolymer transport system component